MTRGALMLCVLPFALVAGCARSGFEAWSCEGQNCSGHGTCVRTLAGQPVCACDPGYTHADPLDCVPEPGPGFSAADASVDALTLDAAGQDLAQADVPAQDRVTADATSGDAAAPDRAAPDGWDSDLSTSDRAAVDSAAGLPPSLDFSSAEGWRLSGGAQIDPAGAGYLDPGHAALGPEAICAAGEICATISVEDLDTEGPRALRFAASKLTLGLCPISLLEVRVDGARYTAPSAPEGSWGLVELCLGQAAYGGEVEVCFTRSAPCGSCPPLMTFPQIFIDNVEIVPVADDSCHPEPGLLNGDFELGERGWSGSGSAGGVGEVVAGADAYGHLARSNRCAAASLRTRLSIPAVESGLRPALSFEVRGSAGVELELRLDDAFLGAVIGSGATEVRRACLLEPFKGAVLPLALRLPEDSGLCDPIDAEFEIDDIAIVDDASCQSPQLLVDGDLETTLADPTRLLPWDVVAYVYSSVGRVDTALAHGDLASLLLSRSAYCDAATARLPFVVPAAQGAAGPMLRYWYRAPLLSQSQLGASWSTGSAGPLATAATWTEQRHCIPGFEAGKLFQFEIELGGPGGLCRDSFPTEAAWIDDLEVVTDLACPP